MRIGFHNINGLKANKGKLDGLLDTMLEENIRIMGIAETNLQEVEGKFILRENQKFKGFWSAADENKKKGSGVGIILREH